MKSAVIGSTIVACPGNRAEGPPPNPLTSGSEHALDDGLPAGGMRLTPRQLEVLALLCEGLPNKLICRELKISAGTVKAHISGILRELGVSSRLQAVVTARRCGLVPEAGERPVSRPANNSRYAIEDGVSAVELPQGDRRG